jgi:single-strand DNA-binding protein
MSINHVVLAGNLTRDAELKSLPSGYSVLEVGIAVNDRVKDQSTGEWTDRPNFFDFVMFGKRADSLATILVRGMKVTIDGRLRWSSWETQDGQKRSRVQVIAENVELPGRPAGANDHPPAAHAMPPASAPWGEDDDSIPF